MSLILDALKKSEAERQRQTGPALLEVRVTQPRRRFPAWVVAVGILLALNLLLLLAFVLYRPVAAPVPAPTAGVASGAAAVTAAAAAPAVAAPSPLPASVAPMAAGAAAPPTLQAASVSGEAGALAPPPRSFSQSDTVTDGQNSQGNPADNEPAVPAGVAAHYSNLPSFSDVGGDLPTLRLDLHVYAERARDRYALINMHRVQEGAALPEGARVLAITREGVALEYRGQEFMLHPQ
jgi:general secretion pathway protein B